MEELAPGKYDGVVVDAEEVDERAVSLEIALTSGSSKGAVVRVRGPRSARDPMSMLGLPVTLDVRDDGIRVKVEGD